ncbi:hypothetical protein TIFTF001_000241 [Ficus carica]|uniref:E3 ubiquitin-protein ligase APD1-4 N-terminal domain-containing protein n=1 Tax=Ficus carica TaxID=3494 RepID=A0AA88D0R3_FICCA|nr:hypothetical protein TIFTF001_000241 [Ficus carica]
MEDEETNQDPPTQSQSSPPSPPPPPPPPPPPSSPPLSPPPPPCSCPPSASAASPTTIGHASSSSSRPSTSQAQEIEEADNRDDNPQQTQGQELPQPQQQERSSVPAPRRNTLASEAAIVSQARTDAVAAVLVLLMFWFLGQFLSQFFCQIDSVSLLQSFYVEALQETRPGPVLYGFQKPPPLNEEITWTEAHNTSEWLYFLNEGSRIDILFRVKSTSYQTVMLVIFQGRDKLVRWIKDPSDLNATLSWHLIHGTKVALLTSPAHNEGSPLGDDWHVILSYGPRWFSYAIMTGLIVVGAFLCCYKSRIPKELQSREMRPERAPLLSPNDVDVLSLGSSDLSLHDDEEDLESSF